MIQKQVTIESLFREFHARLFRQANILLHDEEESKDAVSDVFARLMQTKLWPDDDKIENYLLVAVQHRCLDILAHRQVRQRVERLIPIDNMEYLPETDEEQRYAALRRFVEEELPEQTRQVFLLRFDKRRKYQEIADQLGISEKTVYKHLHQAITQLHNHFNDREQ